MSPRCTRAAAQFFETNFADALLWVRRENFNLRPFARLRRLKLFVRYRVRDTVFNVKPLYNESLPSSDEYATHVQSRESAMAFNFFHQRRR